MSTTQPLLLGPTDAPRHARCQTPTVTFAGRFAIAVLLVATRLRDAVVGLVERTIERGRSERGQATTEYALVLLAAALVALLLVAWATAGGGAAKVSRLFNRVIDAVIDRV